MRFLSQITAGLSILLTACGSSGEAPVSENERATGAEQHPKLLAEFGGAYSGDEAAYVKAIGEKIAAAAGLQGECTFTLVNSDVVNAFAVPGCFIYVTRGLLGIVNSEGELASVLAHEIGHIAGNHVEQQQRRTTLRNLGVWAVNAVTDSQSATRLASAAAGYFTLRHSRKHEYEADDLGLGYLRAAGYDPYSAADMLGALARNQDFMTRSRGRDEARSIPEWALTHPLTQHRIDRSLKAAQGTGLKPDALPENEAAYMASVDGLLYGDDPEQGFVVGRRFSHPVMRIAFEAPEGFTLTNSPQAILIEGPDGVRGEFAGGRLPSGGLQAYADELLRRLLGNIPVDGARIQPERIGGMPAVKVLGSVRTHDGPVALSLVVYDAGGGSAYHFLLVSPPSSAPQGVADRLFQSFRLLNAEEAATLRPRRIKVVRVGTGDSLQTLAGRMAADRPMEHLMMLNGRTSQDPVRPGDAIKLVVQTGR